MVKLRLASVFILLSCAAALQAKPPGVSSTPRFGDAVEVNVVNVEVYATARDGSRVVDLKKADFEVREDGKPVEITHFEVLAGGGASPAALPDPRSTGSAPPPEDAWSLIIFFDNPTLRPMSRTRALRQLRSFLDQQLAPGDRVMLVTHDLSLHIRQPFTGDRAALHRALGEIAALSARGSESDRDRRQAFETTLAIQTNSVEGPCPQNIAAPAHSYASLRRQEVLRSIGALTLLVSSLSGVPGRKAVLHLSDGLPLTPGEEVFQLLVELCGGGGTAGLGQTAIAGQPEVSKPRRGESEIPAPRIGGEDAFQIYDARYLGPQAYQAASQAPLDARGYSVAKQLQTLAAHANAQRVTLYTLQASGLAGPDAADPGVGPTDRLFRFPSIGTVLRANDRDSLQLLADSTGGRSILDSNDFLPGLTRMREDAASYYSLGFTPAHSGDGREHRIEVRVRRPGLSLRYRQSYRDKSPLEKTVDRTLAALLYGIEDNPLDIAVEIGEPTPGAAKTWTVPVRLRIPLFKLAILNQDGTFEGSLRLLVATRTADGGSSPLRQVEVPIRIPRKEVLHAMGQYYLYTLTLELSPGEQRLAIAVRDELATTTSYLSRSVTVGAAAANVRP